jgi:hypothetical protein
MTRILQALLVASLFLGASAINATAQQSGTINTLSVNPRQNVELGGYSGTETGQPSDAVPGSQNESDGLYPSGSSMLGSGSDGNAQQSVPGNQPERRSAKAETRTNSSATQTQAKLPGKTKSKQAER